jgi:hypothetical protein
MKRAVLLILVLFLLLDLGDDGFIGKATFLIPDSAQKISLTFLLEYDSIEFCYTLPAPECRQMKGLLPFQPGTLECQSPIELIICCYTGSSGGIPL